MQDFRGPGNLMLATHQVNITALTGAYPAGGEIFVMREGLQGRPQMTGSLAATLP